MNYNGIAENKVLGKIQSGFGGVYDKARPLGNLQNLEQFLKKCRAFLLLYYNIKETKLTSVFGKSTSHIIESFALH